MKKKLFFIILILIVATSISKNAYAVTSTPTPTPANSPTQSDIQQIDDLKTRIASRVAQLNLVEKKGIIGTVTDSTNSQITLNDINGNTRFVDVDELTKFSNANASGTSFGISDINKGMSITVLGIYNKQSRRILARLINTITLPKIIIGTVTAIDKKIFNFYIASENNKQTFIDIETISKTYSYSSGGNIISAGFSKISTDETILVIGFPDKQNPEHIISSRTILFPDVPKNPKINYIPALDSGSSITPSTGSGRKLTPIIK